jgi:hypothetical protein
MIVVYRDELELLREGRQIRSPLIEFFCWKISSKAKECNKREAYRDTRMVPYAFWYFLCIHPGSYNYKNGRRFLEDMSEIGEMLSYLKKDLLFVPVYQEHKWQYHWVLYVIRPGHQDICIID